MQRILAAIAQLTDTLADPARQTRSVVMLFAAHLVAWTIYAVISTASHDIYYDMAELVAWSLEPALGYPKHPPLPTWIVTAWFAVFPRREWAYYLLSFTNIAIALWFVWLIAQRYLDREKAVVALVLLTLTPVFTFHALKFNANALLIPLWAAATYTFLRSYDERDWRWGGWAGFATGLAMLGKEWSIFLVIGFGVAVLADRRNGLIYLRSRAPWAAVVTGLLVLSPYLYWMARNGFQGFDYAVGQHVMPSRWSVIPTIGNYLIGGFLYMAAPILAVLVAARPDRDTLHDMIRPLGQRRRFMTVIFWASLLSPIVVALALGTRLDSIWTLSSWCLLPVLLLGSPGITISRRRIEIIVGAACAFPLVMVVVSPIVMLVLHQRGMPNYAGHGSLLVRDAERHWRALTGDKPLRHVAGTQQLAWAMTFYGRDKARAFPEFSRELAPWINPDDLVREGWVGLCAAEDTACIRNARALAARSANTRELGVDLPNNLLGIRGEVRSFLIVLVPPA